MNKLPQMAKQLEVSLYRDAPSFEAYMNMNTLKQRLQQIAVEVSRKTRNQANQGGDSSRDDRRQHFDRQQQSQQPQQHQQPYGRSDGPSSPQFMQNGNANNGQRMGNDMNPMVGPPQGYDQRMQPSRSRGGMRDSRGNPNDPDVKVRIRHKQQRLLLLHHSAKCPQEDGRCTVTPHCADMKRLWRHMEGCKDNKCQVSHCFSSRAILSHYRKCRDSNCPACGPVRETVRRNRNSGSTSRPTASTGPMMNSMRDAMMQQPPPPPPQQQPQEQASQQPQQSDVSYTSSSSSSRNRQAMPPPVSQSTQGGSQYSQMSQQYSSQGSSRNFGGSSQSPDQPMYDQQKNGDSSRGVSLSNQSQRSKDGATGSIASSSRSGGSGNRNDPEYQKIRHKQQRLLLLRHASRCQHEPGKCTVTPHCASMKRLWEHIAHCKNSSALSSIV